MRTENRTPYFDYLRVFASFAIMILHISAYNWYRLDVNSFEWQVLNFFDSIVRWGVPVFVMISGALFLDREIPVKKIYSKYIFRMVTAFVAWAIVYMYFLDGSIAEKVSLLICGQYHMWFIFMIIGLYMCIPIIKPVTQDGKRMKYYILLAFLFAFLIPQMVMLADDFGGEVVAQRMAEISADVSNMNMQLVFGYASYFILGYYLHKTDLNKKQRTIIYLCGMVGFAATIGLTLIVALKTQQVCLKYYDNFTVNVLFESIAVFTWFKYRKCRFPQLYPLIVKLSQYSFGAYLVHVLIIDQLDVYFGLNTLSFNTILAVIFIGIVVFVISFLISAIINHIPVVKKYVV